ncbi:hypothetical protein ACL655_21935 [Klebsiella quasipneumoniae subsp. similipneumoniae]
MSGISFCKYLITVDSYRQASLSEIKYNSQDVGEDALLDVVVAVVSFSNPAASAAARGAEIIFFAKSKN